MSLIDCLTLAKDIVDDKVKDRLLTRQANLMKEGMSEKKAGQTAINEFANEYGNKLNEDLNKLKKSIKLPTSDAIFKTKGNAEEINKSYDEQVKNISQPINTEQNAIPKQEPNEMGIRQSSEVGTTMGIGDTQSESTASPQEKSKATSEEKVSTGGENGVVGIAQRVREQRADALGLSSAEIGVGWTKEEALQRGKELIRDGVNPDDVVEDFNKDKKISDDTIAIVQARTHELAKKTNEAGDKYGIDSSEYKKALQEENDWLEKTKPMQTIWNRAGVAQQGEIDIDTGTFTGLSRAYKQETGKDFTPQQAKEAKELSGQVKDLTDEVVKLKKQVTDLMDKAGSEAVVASARNIKEKAKQIADTIRKGKLSRPDTFSAASPASIVWDGALETAAKLIETGGTIAQAISDGLKHIEKSEWYKQLSDDKKKDAKDDFTKYFEDNIKNTDTLTRFVGKKDSNFTIEEVKAIWDYAKENYIDKDADFEDMVHGVATDLGLSPNQVRTAISQPKGVRIITNEMYRKQYQRTQAVNRAKNWVATANNPQLTKLAKAIPNLFFGLKVFGHGTVGMITHAGTNLFRPSQWASYWRSFFKQFKFAYGDTAAYEKAMSDLVHDDDFIFWKRAGLAVDPTTKYDDYQFLTKFFGKLGTAGDRGFNALKVYRLEQAKAIYKGVSVSGKADPNTAKEIAKIVNHATGTSKIPLPEAFNVAFFAPRLEASRWARIIGQPAKAITTFTKWGSATPSEKAAAKIIAKRSGELIATYIGALVANQGLMMASGSNQKINFTDPTSPDWMKFKFGEDHTIDATGGMVSALSLVGKLLSIATESTSQIPKGKNRVDQVTSVGSKYIFGKLSPFAGTVKDFATQHDFSGNTMPFSKDKPFFKDGKKLTWLQYIEEQQTPIPIAESIKDVHQQMKDEGMKEATINEVMWGILVGAVSGGTGARLGVQPVKGNESKKSNVQTLAH